MLDNAGESQPVVRDDLDPSLTAPDCLPAELLLGANDADVVHDTSHAAFGGGNPGGIIRYRRSRRIDALVRMLPSGRIHRKRGATPLGLAFGRPDRDCAITEPCCHFVQVLTSDGHGRFHRAGGDNAAARADVAEE
jgi:hypothetical protein